jgi:hypothetical protein
MTCLNHLSAAVIALLAATICPGQVVSALDAVGNGALKGGTTVAKGAAKSAVTIAEVVPPMLLSAATSGVVLGVASTSVLVAYDAAEVGTRIGFSLLKPIASATADVTLGCMRAGWRLTLGKHRAEGSYRPSKIQTNEKAQLAACCTGSHPKIRRTSSPAEVIFPQCRRPGL